MDGMTTSWALMGIAACGLLVLGLLAALLLVHGQHLQALLVAQCRHNVMQRNVTVSSGLSGMTASRVRPYGQSVRRWRSCRGRLSCCRRC